MQLIRHNPQHCLSNRQHNAAKLFDNFFDDFFAPTFHHKSADRTIDTSLQVDIYEKEEKIIIDAEMPGIAKEDIILDVKGRLLTLGGEKKIDDEITEEQKFRRERRYGKFERTFSLPFEIDAEAVTARYKDGILRLEIPKPQEQQTKQIEIN